jgi:hypothetical protein
LALLERRLQEKDALLRAEKMRNNKLEQTLGRADSWNENAWKGASSIGVSSPHYDNIRNKIMNTKSTASNIHMEIDNIYKSNIDQVEALINKKGSLKNDIQKHQEYETNLIEQLKYMAQKLYEIENAYRKNESDMHHTLIAIQEDIKKMSDEFDMTKQRLLREINIKQKEIEKLLSENERQNVNHSVTIYFR